MQHKCWQVQEVLVDRAVHAAAARFLCLSSDVLKFTASDAPHATSSLCMMERPLVETKQLIFRKEGGIGNFGVQQGFMQLCACCHARH